MLRRVSVDGQRSWFDTNIKPHHHFYVDEEQQLIDIDNTSLQVVGMPELPKGRELEQVDVIIRIDIFRTITRRLIMATAMGKVLCDGEEIYNARDLRVGLFKQGEAPA